MEAAMEARSIVPPQPSLAYSNSPGFHKVSFSFFFGRLGRLGCELTGGLAGAAGHLDVEAIKLEFCTLHFPLLLIGLCSCVSGQGLSVKGGCKSRLELGLCT